MQTLKRGSEVGELRDANFVAIARPIAPVPPTMSAVYGAGMGSAIFHIDCWMELMSWLHSGDESTTGTFREVLH